MNSSQSNTAQVGEPAVNLNVERPEWAVIGVPHGGSDEHHDRIHVWQNECLVADARADEPTYDALSHLVKCANAYKSDQRKIAALVGALEGLLNAITGMGYQDIPVIEEAHAQARAALQSAKE